MSEPQRIQIKCPNCGTPYQAAVNSIVDVGQNPELRNRFLSGQLNVATCPNCKHSVMLEVPLVYHDPQAEFLAVYLPPQVNLPEMERQKMIGDMTQSLMRSLPPEQRKGYFLNPRQFINRQSLVDAVLGTMGVSQEELDRRRQKMKLLDQAVVMADDAKGLEMLTKAQDAQFDYEFFMILSSLLDQAQKAGDQEAAGRLLGLRNKLMGLTSFGKRAARQEEAISGLKDVKSVDELLQRVVAAEPDQIDAIALAARPLMDYSFFQELTERVEASSGAERDRLTQLRDRLLNITQQLDDATRASMRESSELLRELVSAENPRSAVREHAEEIDDIFMAVLSLNMQEAQKQGATAALQRMEIIGDEIMAMVEEGLPPEMQLINDLLRVPYPEGTRSVLKERQGEVTPELLQLMDQMSQELSEREDKEAAKRLRDIKAQAMLLV